MKSTSFKSASSKKTSLPKATSKQATNNNVVRKPTFRVTIENYKTFVLDNISIGCLEVVKPINSIAHCEYFYQGKFHSLVIEFLPTYGMFKKKVNTDYGTTKYFLSSILGERRKFEDVNKIREKKKQPAVYTEVTIASSMEYEEFLISLFRKILARIYELLQREAQSETPKIPNMIIDNCNNFFANLPEYNEDKVKELIKIFFFKTEKGAFMINHELFYNTKDGTVYTTINERGKPIMKNVNTDDFDKLLIDSEKALVHTVSSKIGYISIGQQGTANYVVNIKLLMEKISFVFTDPLVIGSSETVANIMDNFENQGELFQDVDEHATN